MRSWGLFQNPVTNSVFPVISWLWSKLVCLLLGHLSIVQANNSLWCVRCGQENKDDIR